MRLDGSKVLREREIRALNVPDAAKMLGISGNALLNAEHSDDIRPATARKIAAGYSLTVADLYPALGGETAPKAPAQPSPEQAERLREIREKYRPYVEGLDAYIEDYVGLIRNGTAERRDAAGFVRTLRTIGQSLLRVHRDELEDIADALGLARSAGEQIISGVPEEAVGANVDARLFEHSEMRAGLQRYFELGESLADTVGDVEGAKAVRDTSRRVFGAAA